MAVRREPVPSAYRVFFRHIGLDPEVQRTPIEAAVLERMTKGGFLSGGLLEDALLIALIDTRVPVAALDAEHVDGPLGIRASVEGERLGRRPDAAALPAGRLVVADASSPLAVLFGEARRRPSADRAHAQAVVVRRAGRRRAGAVRRRGPVGVRILAAGELTGGAAPPHAALG